VKTTLVRAAEHKLLTNQTTVIVDITICKTTLVRAAEQVQKGWKDEVTTDTDSKKEARPVDLEPVF
jgi:hypothetical protein